MEIAQIGETLILYAVLAIITFDSRQIKIGIAASIVGMNVTNSLRIKISLSFTYLNTKT